MIKRNSSTKPGWLIVVLNCTLNYMSIITARQQKRYRIPLRITKVRIQFLIFIFFILVANSICQPYKDEYSINSPQNILAFADFLFCEQDYLRAIDEYKKYLNIESNDSIQFKIAISYKLIREYEVSEAELNKITSASFSSNIFYEKLKLKFLLEDFTGLQEIYSNSLPKRVTAEQIYLASHLFEKKKLPEKNEFLKNFSDSLKPAFERFYLRKINPSYKNLVVAGVLSAVIPGSGKIYVGQIGDGITATIIIGLLSFISYDNFRANHKVRGWVFAGISSLFYAGNIYGSATAAQIHNAKVDVDYYSDLKKYIQQKDYLLPKNDFECK